MPPRKNSSTIGAWKRAPVLHYTVSKSVGLSICPPVIWIVLLRFANSLRVSLLRIDRSTRLMQWLIVVEYVGLSVKAMDLKSITFNTKSTVAIIKPVILYVFALSATMIITVDASS
jgi:hypothetical protein